MSLDNPLAGQTYTLAKPFKTTDLTFQIVGRFEKTNAGTFNNVGQQILGFSIGESASKLENVFINITANPTLISAESGIFEYTIAQTSDRGLDSENTDSTSLLSSTDMIKNHPAGRKVTIVNSPIYLAERGAEFETSTVVVTKTTGEAITVRNAISLHTDNLLYKYNFTNFPSFVGIANDTAAISTSLQYTTFGGLSTGHSGLTVGGTVFAENTGAITQSSSSTTTQIGKAESATTIRITATEPTPALTQAQIEDGSSTVEGSTSGELAGQAKQSNLATHAVDSAGSDTYVITLSPTLTALADGQEFVFEAGTLNTGAATLNIDGLGAKAIVKNFNAALETGDILAGQKVTVCYDLNTDTFQMTSPSAATPTDSDVTAATTISAMGSVTMASPINTNVTVNHALGRVPKLIIISTGRGSTSEFQSGASFSEAGTQTTFNSVSNGTYNTTSMIVSSVTSTDFDVKISVGTDSTVHNWSVSG